MSLDLTPRAPESLLADVLSGKHKFVHEGVTYWVKHETFLEDASLEEFRAEKEKELREQDLWITEEDKLLIAEKSETWTRADEKELEKLKAHLIGQRNTLKRLVIEAQKDQVAAQIKKTEGKVLDLSYRRRLAVGQTSEHLVDRMVDHRRIEATTFLDSALLTPIGTVEEDSPIARPYYAAYNSFGDEAMKRMAVLWAVQRPLHLSEGGVDSFYGKPIIFCTNSQSKLLEYARIVYNVHKNYTDMPAEKSKDFDAMMAYVDDVNNKKKTVTKQKDSAETTAKAVHSQKELQEELRKDPKATTPAMMLAANGGKKIGLKQLI